MNSATTASTDDNTGQQRTSRMTADDFSKATRTTRDGLLFPVTDCEGRPGYIRL